MKKIVLITLCSLLFTGLLTGQEPVRVSGSRNDFPIVSATASPLLIDPAEEELIKIAAGFFSDDIGRVSGKTPVVTHEMPASGNLILIGTSAGNRYIRDLEKRGKINLSDIRNKWEGYHLEVVSKPFKGIETALVVAGSDRRGAAYGALELSRQIGVSPWYWWADVPEKKKTALYLPANFRLSDAPKIKYRGIFLNDEAPSLTGWAREKFGGLNHVFYEKVFELLLRLKANYLWPAMWGNAFNDDDTLNPVLADKYGIVMGTSHHEPMLRAQQEWKRYGKGKWDYDSNEVVLKNFWKKGMENMGTHESIVTIGMRGDGDMPMSRETATALLERIVKDQREIIENVTGKPANKTPQLWALYKEVQDYYDKGMRVPDDVTLLLCDDNWGNIRKLPALNAPKRTGGYGIYYHFDYVGGPRNYKWLNTNPLPRIWEQMHLAYEYNVRDIWIVNVGDLKPMEFPISFWCDYAWNPEKIGAGDLQAYTEQWAAAQFGTPYAKEIAGILADYGKFNGRKKPEMLSPTTYSIDHYEEFQTVVKEYNALLKKAEEIGKKLSPEYSDAYFQLVLHPVWACANLNEMYYYAALNQAYAPHNVALANQWADKVKENFGQDSLITQQYHELNKGKWNHMMDQKHIGYRSWQEPRVQTMPTLQYLGDSVVTFDVVIPAAPLKFYTGPLSTEAIRPAFIETNEYVSIEADHYTMAVNGKDIHWQVLPDHGRTGSAMTVFPVTAARQEPGGDAPHLAYDFYTYSSGEFKLQAYFSPTYNFHDTEQGLEYAVSVDGASPQMISINKESKATEGGIMYNWVADNIIIKTSTHSVSQPGKHVLRFWAVHPGVVLQKLVLDFGGVQASYFGPPETPVNTKK